MAYHPQSELLANPSPEDELMHSISVDCVILGFEDEKLKVLLIQHHGGPKDGEWALPGDFIKKNIDLEKMPYDVLHRLTGIQNIFVDQFGTFGNLNRVDYRRIITVGYYALVSPQKYDLKLGKAAKKVEWFDVSDTPNLIFDHSFLLESAIKKLQEDLETKPIGHELLAEEFTLTQMQKLYEAILGEKQDIRNFRRKILNLKVLEETGNVDDSVPYRAPKLYKFKKK
ncbi:NUDIX hydrolase [Portibacter lacus]|uniref:ADP-ribose pyrophosphatase n=1 Tax=Portibacter lacus TaxID=1099794 RepID=A0AA37SYB1_9BACT|nr:NUDIX hydrolase [Portibacter lacus]GLR19803.1 ADP-ribose pyrophosphatase [Portibacter lacus]